MQPRSVRPKRSIYAVVVLAAAYLMGLVALLGAGPQQPLLPTVYHGSVFLNGQPAPDGWEIFGRIGNYSSPSVKVSGGKYSNLAISPPDSSYTNRTLTFHATLGSGDVQATETVLYTGQFGVVQQDLHFTAAPPVPTPTPTPTPAPVSPTIYSGIVLIGGLPAPDGTQIFARVEGFETPPVQVQGSRYTNLVIAPPNSLFVGKKVTFHARVGSTVVTAQQEVTFSGELKVETLDLMFPGSVATPTPTATPTATPLPPIVGDPSVASIPVVALVVGSAALVVGLVVLGLARRKASL